MTTDLPGLAKKLDRLHGDLTGPGLSKALTKVGMEGKSLIAGAVQNDLGDLSMSNWRRGKPIQVTGRLNVLGDTSVEILPAKRASGPMRVLEQGRTAGMSRGTKKRKSRPVSGSAGKGTWSDATKKMEDELPKVVETHVRSVLSRTFGG